MGITITIIVTNTCFIGSVSKTKFVIVISAFTFTKTNEKIVIPEFTVCQHITSLKIDDNAIALNAYLRQ